VTAVTAPYPALIWQQHSNSHGGLLPPQQLAAQQPTLALHINDGLFGISPALDCPATMVQLSRPALPALPDSMPAAILMA